MSGWRSPGRRARQSRPALLDCLSEGVLVLGRGLEIRTANHAAGQILGIDPDKMPSLSLVDQVLDDDGAPIAPAARDTHPLFRAVRHAESAEDLRVRFLRPDGSQAWLAANVVPMYDGQHREVVVTFSDVSRERESIRQLDRPALSDPLTGLASRRLLEDHLATALERRDNRVAVLFVDVNGLAAINAAHGYAGGDAVLQEIGRRLRHHCRPSDAVARFGGDEFVVMCDGFRDDDDAHSICLRLIQGVATPIDVFGTRTRVSVSAGLALAGVDHTPDDLIAGAELAMHDAKAKGTGRIAVHNPEMAQDSVPHIVAERDLRDALDEGRVDCWYQPQVSLGSGRITSVEALARWDDGSPPAVFIPVAERTGMVSELGAVILERAVVQGARWRRTRIPDLKVWVNVSGLQIQDPEFPDQVAAMLWEHGMNPAGLGLEIAESVLMQDAMGVRANLEALRTYGVTLAIDDFGTGYSSLAYLRLLPVDRIKLDGRLVHDVHTSRDAEVIARAIVEMAHTLGLTVTAEGVENDAQLTTLMDMGVDEAQGFHLAHPQPAAELDRLLVGAPAPG